MPDRDQRLAKIVPSASPLAIEWAAERLIAGDVIALPTDTVYGIAVALTHPERFARLFEIKGRPESKPLSVLISSTAVTERLATGATKEQLLLAERYWPGPLTVAFPATAGLAPEITASDGTIGLRVPNHPLAIEVIARAGGAIVCTSANRAGEPAARTAEAAAAEIGDGVSLVLDGGMTPGGQASTVIGFAGDGLRLFREGPIPIEHLRWTWRELLAGRDG